MTGTDADTASDYAVLGPDPTSLRNLAAQSLRYAVVDTADPDAFGAWLRAEDRGFMQPTKPEAQLALSLNGLASRRTIGMYDSMAADSDGPVATTDSWPANLDRLGVHEVPIESRHALVAGDLSWAHRDPFDRMIAAQSMLEGFPLVTSDGAFATLPGLHRVW